MSLKKNILLLIISLSISLTFAQSNQPNDAAVITLTPSSQIVNTNDPVSITVGVQGVVDLFAISITLSFDNSIVKCLHISQGDFLSTNAGGYDVFFETFPGNLYSANTVIVDQSILGLASVSGSGEIFTITFEPFAEGTTNIEVTSVTLRDINNVEIAAISEPAEITVSSTVLIKLTPSSQTVDTNDPVSISVEVQGVVGLFAISVTLTFNNSIVKCLNITQGNFLSTNTGGYDVFYETFPADLYSANTVIVDQSILGRASVTGSGTIFTITFEPFAEGTTTVQVASLSLRDINNLEITAISVPAEIIVSSSVVNAEVFLQGPYDSGSMLTTLNSSGVIPLTQPYSGPPWNYAGTESVATDFFTTHPSIVDWVLVELRTATSASSTIATRAALLKNDGVIVDLDGVSPVSFLFLNSNDNYIVIKHRNHLAIMSSTNIQLTSTTPLYDFTSSQLQAYGSNAMIELDVGIFGMIAADANGNGQVQNNDRENYWVPQNGQSGYKAADYNLNGQVQNNDNEFYWVPNNGKGTQVPN
ncbi:MAG: hypothetical protein IPJ23_19045 [Ignavibacteriales bacterium]|nr:hypothetical protein [Ignavibacteriales bacterium]